MSTKAGLTDARRRALDQLLGIYLELPPQEREGFLFRCEQRYPRLSRWFVRLALESRTTTSLLTQSPDTIAEQALEELGGVEAPELETGTRLGPWRIIETVGVGGMGKVYLGERADGAFEMEVAIKLIASRRVALAEQLSRECRLLARLDHPAITRLIDAGLSEEGEPYLVMEWVDGVNLDAWLEEHSFSLEQRLIMFLEITEAVAHAHQRLIVHGDIKPGNVRIREDGQVKLMDFGVAILMTDSGIEGQRVAAMTPAFAAPEQLAGEPVTTRSDVWALGALLHAMLTGAAPERDKGESVSGEFAGLARSGELRAIIRHACQTEPECRYESVQALANDTQRFLNDEPLSAAPPGRVFRTLKFVRRNKLAVALALVIVLALLAGTVISTTLYIEAERERLRAERHARELELVATFQAEQLSGIDTALMGVTLRDGLFDQQRALLEEQGADETEILLGLDELEGILAGMNFSNVALGWLEDNVLADTVAGIERQFADQPLVRARLLQSVASTMRNLALYERAGRLQEEALEIRRQKLGADHPRTLASMSATGRLLRSQGNLAEAEVYERQALAGRRRTLGDDHPDTLSSISNLGVLLRHQGRPSEAEPFYREALQGRMAALGADDPDTLTSKSNYGVLLVGMDRLEEAEYWMGRALDGRRKVLGDDDRSTLQSLNNMGVLLRNQERYEEAEDFYREALERSRRIRGDEHPATLDIVNNLGVVLERQERLDESATYYREALAGSRVVLGDDHPATLASIYNMARILRETGDLEEAEVLGREAVERASKQLQPGHWHTAVFQGGYGKTLAAVGRYSEAETHLLAAHEVFVDVLGEQHVRTIEAMEGLAEYYNDRHNEQPASGYDEQRDHWQSRVDALIDNEGFEEGSNNG